MHATLMLFISLLMTSKENFVTISCFEFCFDSRSTIGSTKTYSQNQQHKHTNKMAICHETIGLLGTMVKRASLL
jgi:hypothetical protein